MTITVLPSSDAGQRLAVATLGAAADQTPGRQARVSWNATSQRTLAWSLGFRAAFLRSVISSRSPDADLSEEAVTVTAMTIAAPLAGIAPAPGGVSYDAACTPEAPSRWAGLDAARGVAVAGMLLVEQLPIGPRSHPWLIHAAWNGWTGADLVFPAFLFLAGIGIDELVRRRGRTALLRLTRRAVALVVLGVLFNAWAGAGADFTDARWPGVLQRIGVVSLACGAVVILCRRGIWPILLLAGAMLVLYAQLLIRVPLACGTGVLTPACNLPGHLDLALFGAAHVYNHGAFGYDPEGLLSTVGALATALIGVAVGRAMRARPGWLTMAALCGTAFACWVATHAGLAGPAVNKRMWTPAFVLLTAAISIILLLACHLVADLCARQPNQILRFGSRVVGWPWAVLGRNALVVYVGQHVLGAVLAQTPVHVGPRLTTAAGYLQAHTFAGGWLGLDPQWTYVTVMLLLWTAVAAAMHRARWYVTL
jgi:predicted acyltransferase